MEPKDKKIHANEDGEEFAAIVPAAFFKWSEGKSAEEIGRYMQWVLERLKAGDEEALKTVPFFATKEHIQAWDEGYSVSERDQ